MLWKGEITMSFFQKNGKIIIRPSFWLHIVGAFLTLLGLVFFVETISSKGVTDNATQNILLFFASLMLFAGGILWFLCTLGYRIEIDENGVREFRVFPHRTKRFLSWKDVKAWGFTYQGKNIKPNLFLPHEIFYFYFSPHSLSSHDQFAGEKRLDPDCIMCQCSKWQLKRKILPVIVPLGKRFTSVPFFVTPSV